MKSAPSLLSRPVKTPPVRVAHLVSHPIQYFGPLYRELARRPEIDLTVYFFSDSTLREHHRDREFGRAVRWDIPLVDGYRYRILPSAQHHEPESRRPNPDLLRELLHERYAVLWTHAYTSANVWLARLIAAATGAAFLVRQESILLDPRPLHVQAVKQVALRALFWRSWALSIGRNNSDYFGHYGVPPERIFPAHYCVDNDFFRSGARGLAPQREAIRRQFGITDERPVILFCAKFIPKKQPLLLLEAFERLGGELGCWLLMVGDGELRAPAEAMVAERGIQRVLFAGFMNQTELPRAYTAADIFVLPSAYQETWGLVVNEAMNYGLPVVVSDRVGCARDLVEAGRNGFVFPHHDAGALAAALQALAADAGLRQRYGQESLNRIGRYSIAACADGIVDACLAASGQARQAVTAGA